MQGILYRVSLSTGDHRIEVPIVLSSELDLKVIFWAGIAPPVLLYSFNKFLYRPLRRRHKLSKVCPLVQGLCHNANNNVACMPQIDLEVL